MLAAAGAVTLGCVAALDGALGVRVALGCLRSGALCVGE